MNVHERPKCTLWMAVCRLKSPDFHSPTSLSTQRFTVACPEAQCAHWSTAVSSILADWVQNTAVYATHCSPLHMI